MQGTCIKPQSLGPHGLNQDHWAANSLFSHLGEAKGYQTTGLLLDDFDQFVTFRLSFSFSLVRGLDDDSLRSLY
jgi:hypothetical protein